MSLRACGLRRVAGNEVLAMFCRALRVLAGPASVRPIRLPSAAGPLYSRTIMSVGATAGIGLAGASQRYHRHGGDDCNAVGSADVSHGRTPVRDRCLDAFPSSYSGLARATKSFSP